MYPLRRRDCSPYVGGRRAAGRFAFLLLVLAILAACTADERRSAACRAAFALLAPEAAIEGERQEGDVVEVSGEGRNVACRFGRDTPAGPALVEIVADGRTLSPVRAQLLRSALRLPTPAELLAPAARPAPVSAQLAYALQQLVNGLSIGALLGLVAVGYALVYGVTGSIQLPTASST